MTMKYLFWVNLICLYCTFSNQRGRYSSFFEYMLTEHQYKERKKGQNFIEWLLFSRFKDILPTSFKVGYYVTTIVNIISTLVSAIFWIIGFDSIIAKYILSGVCVYNGIIIVAWYLFFGYRTGVAEGPKFGRFFRKRHGQTKKKRWLSKK